MLTIIKLLCRPDEIAFPLRSLIELMNFYHLLPAPDPTQYLERIGRNKDGVVMATVGYPLINLPP